MKNTAISSYRTIYLPGLPDVRCFGQGKLTCTNFDELNFGSECYRRITRGVDRRMSITKLNMDRPANLNFKCCSFCPIEKHELYKCPQCSAYYCSLRCFRSKKHLRCSEEFYRKQCVKHLEFSPATSETKAGIKGKEATITTFEQYMAQHEQNSNEKIAEDKANPQIAVNANEEILFDSDDEPEYLSKMVSSTLEQFHSTDNEELNRRILSAGLPMPLGSETFSTGEDSQEQMEHLYQKLTTEEKRKFTELADEMFRDDLQLEMNCFAKKSVKK